MVFNKLKSTAKERGFTIVELLIVIVVIAILAAITIVAYNGVQQKAKTTQAQTNAVQAQKVAEAFNVDPNTALPGYPKTAADFTAGTIAKLPTTITIGYAAPTTLTGTTTLQYYYCGASTTAPAAGSVLGGKIVYWDYTTGALSTNILYIGSGVPGTVSAVLTPSCQAWFNS